MIVYVYYMDSNGFFRRMFLEANAEETSGISVFYNDKWHLLGHDVVEDVQALFKSSGYEAFITMNWIGGKFYSHRNDDRAIRALRDYYNIVGNSELVSIADAYINKKYLTRYAYSMKDETILTGQSKVMETSNESLKADIYIKYDYLDMPIEWDDGNIYFVTLRQDLCDSDVKEIIRDWKGSWF